MVPGKKSIWSAWTCAVAVWLSLTPPVQSQVPAVLPDMTLDTADATAGWRSSSGNALTADAQIKVHGAASVKSTGGGGVRFRKLLGTPLDVSRFKYLTFWYYVDNPDLIAQTGDTGQIEISSSNTDDQQEWFWNVASLNLQRGWNYVLLDLPGKVRRGPVDATQIRRIRIYHASTAPMTVRIDNIAFSNREPRSFPFAEYLEQKRIASSTTAAEQLDDMFAFALRTRASSAERARVCRYLKIDLTHREISSHSLEKLGVSRATLTPGLHQRRLLKEFICSEIVILRPDLLAILQGRAAADVAVINTLASLYGLTSEAAAETASRLLDIDMGRILRSCGGAAREVDAFIATGAMPPSIFPGPNVLVPQCMETPSQIAVMIGGFHEPVINDRRANYQQCMSAFENLGSQCDNPYASPDSDFEDALRRSRNLNDAARESARRDMDEMLDSIESITVLDARESTGQATHADPQHPEFDQLENLHEEFDRKSGQIEYTEQLIDHTQDNMVPPAGTPPLESVGYTSRQAATLTRLQDELVQLQDEQEDILRQICHTNPDDQQCPSYMANEPPPPAEPPPPPPQTQRCASMASNGGQNVWFNKPVTPGNPAGPVNPFAAASRQLNEGDRIDHCLCQLFDRAYGRALPGDVVQFPTNCPTPEERVAQKCLENPQDGIDGIRRECRHLMQPISLDRDSLVGEMCHTIRPACDGPFLKDDDDCGCGTIRTDGTMQLPGCRLGIPNCLDGIPVQDRFGNCGCQPFGSGINQCTAGGKDFFLAMDPINDLKVRAFPDRPGFGNEPLLVTRPGPVRFVTPGIKRRQLPGNGSQLWFNAGLVGNSTDKTGNIKVYCTNTSASDSLRNRLIETIPLSMLSSTGPTALPINLSSTERAICYGSNPNSNVHLEFSVESAPAQSVGFLDILGDLGNIKPPCVDFPPRPTPGFRPLSNWPDLWTFSNGVTVAPKFNGVGPMPPVETSPIFGGICVIDGIPVPCN
jgi:hypothetical protein